ncbi:MAG: type II toxin-antitoxin system RelE/ParE family toxin [Atopobiaceae bacterium]
MGFKCILLPQAQLDYESIVRYLAVDLASPQAAGHFVDEFDKQAALVCSHPDMYALSRIPEVARHGWRPMRIMRYVALYSVRDDNIVISHIFHQSQDYARLV